MTNTDPNQLLENWEKDIRKEFTQAWNSDEKRHDIENGLVYIVRNLLALQEAKTREEVKKELLPWLNCDKCLNRSKEKTLKIRHNKHCSNKTTNKKFLY